MDGPISTENEGTEVRNVAEKSKQLICSEESFVTAVNSEDDVIEQIDDNIESTLNFMYYFVISAANDFDARTCPITSKTSSRRSLPQLSASSY